MLAFWGNEIMEPKYILLNYKYSLTRSIVKGKQYDVNNSLALKSRFTCDVMKTDVGNPGHETPNHH